MGPFSGFRNGSRRSMMKKDSSFVEPSPSFRTLLRGFQAKCEVPTNAQVPAAFVRMPEVGSAKLPPRVAPESSKLSSAVHLTRMNREQAKQASLRNFSSTPATTAASHEDEGSVTTASKKVLPPAHLRNVYQQPMEEAFSNTYKYPVFDRTPQERKQIQSALKRNFVFQDLLDRDVEPLILAFETCSFGRNMVIIKEGDPGDYFYIIKQGEVLFQIQGQTVGGAGEGSSFGELGLLYTVSTSAYNRFD